MIRSLKRVLGRGAHPRTFRECRDCGTTVDRPTARCPACGSAEIADYDL